MMNKSDSIHTNVNEQTGKSDYLAAAFKRKYFFPAPSVRLAVASEILLAPPSFYGFWPLLFGYYRLPSRAAFWSTHQQDAE